MALEEGFSGDAVTVRVAGKKAFEARALQTMLQVGLADQFSVDVPDGDVEVSIEAPRRGVAHRQKVAVDGPTYIGISLEETGDVKVRTSSEPFGYV